MASFGGRLREKGDPTESEQHRTPELQSRVTRNNIIGMTCGSSEGGKAARSKLVELQQNRRETQEASMDIAGQKKRRVIKSENQGKEDEMSAMKNGVQRNENLRHEGEQRIKTELAEVETAGTGITNTAVLPETSQKMGAFHEVNKTTFPPEKEIDDDILSRLNSPPQVPNTSGLATELLQAYALSIPTVKNALISFLTTTKPDAAALMITQANSTFTSLYALSADYVSFYNNVRSYIQYCSKFSTAEKELEENMESLMLVSCYEDTANQSTEVAKAVSDVEATLLKAKEYRASIEARYQETNVLLDKLGAELAQRETEVADLESEKMQRKEALAAIEMKQQAIAAKAKQATEKIHCILRRREAARAAVEETRALLSSS